METSGAINRETWGSDIIPVMREEEGLVREKKQLKFEILKCQIKSFTNLVYIGL